MLKDVAVLDRWRSDVAEGYYRIESERDAPGLPGLRFDFPVDIEADTLAIQRMAPRLLPDLDDRAIRESAVAVTTWYRTGSARTLPATSDLFETIDLAMAANLALVRTLLSTAKDYPVRDIEEELDDRVTASVAVLAGRIAPGWPPDLDPAQDFEGPPVQWKDVAARLYPGKRAKTIEQRCREHAAAGKRDVWAFLVEVRRRCGIVPQSALDVAAAFTAQRAAPPRA